MNKYKIEDLPKLTAEKVMNSETFFLAGDLMRVTYKDDERRDGEYWQPHIDLNQSFKMLGKFCWRSSNAAHVHWVGVNHGEWIEHDSLPIAICLACLEAVGYPVDLEDDNG